MVDINRALRLAATTGKVEIGTKATAHAVKNGHAKLVVLARNLPQDARGEIESAARAKGVAVVDFDGPNVELGPACGKPFAVAALAVLEPGQSDVLQLRNQR